MPALDQILAKPRIGERSKRIRNYELSQRHTEPCTPESKSISSHPLGQSIGRKSYVRQVTGTLVLFEKTPGQDDRSQAMPDSCLEDASEVVCVFGRGPRGIEVETLIIFRTCCVVT